MLTARERLLSTAVVCLLTAGATTAAALPPDREDVGAPGARPTSADRSPALPAPSVDPSRKALPSASPVAARPLAQPAAQPLPEPPRVPARAGAEPPQAGCPVPRRPDRGTTVPKPRPAPAVAEAALPTPVPAGPKASSLDAVRGKGVWITNFKQTPVDVAGTVAAARAAGVTSIWVRTGGRQGYYGDQFLPRLVPAARAAGLKVIAWDFPFLSDPVADARRAQQAYADGVDAFSPDIETSAEGTYATPRRVTLYLSLVRSYAGTRPVVATVPRPTPRRLASFPYAAFRPYADVFAPMVYWSCHEPGELVEQSLRQLGRWLPVAPVGQAYDMGDEGGRRGLPTAAETRRFLDVARRGGAVGASLWTLERMGPGQRAALSTYPWDSISPD